MEHGPSSNNEKMELFKSQVLIIDQISAFFDPCESETILGQTVVEEIEYKICIKDEH